MVDSIVWREECFQFYSLVSSETENSTNNCQKLDKTVIRGRRDRREDLSLKAVVLIRLICLQRAEAQAHLDRARFTEKAF